MPCWIISALVCAAWTPAFRSACRCWSQIKPTHPSFPCLPYHIEMVSLVSLKLLLPSTHLMDQRPSIDIGLGLPQLAFTSKVNFRGDPADVAGIQQDSCPALSLRRTKPVPFCNIEFHHVPPCQAHRHASAVSTLDCRAALPWRRASLAASAPHAKSPSARFHRYVRTWN